MAGISAELASMFGTVPQWGMFGALVIILAKQVVPWRQQNIDQNSNWCKNLMAEVATLKQELKDCEANCTAESKALHEEIFGMRRQHIQEQISLINTIMRSVDAPELQGMIGLLERVQQNLVVARQRQQEHNNEEDDGKQWA